jgi:hypothetical protein
MRHSENEREAFKRRDSREFRPQRKRGSVLIAARKGISQENAAFSRLIVQKQTITGRNEAEKLRRSFNSKDLERLPAAETQIRLSLRWLDQRKEARKG